MMAFVLTLKNGSIGVVRDWTLKVSHDFILTLKYSWCLG